MKTIKKITLCLLTMAGFSTWNTASAAELEVIFIDGAEFEGVITGKANFNGSGNIILSGSATDNVRISAGNVKIAAASSLLGTVTMNGGDLEATAAMTVPSLIMSSAATLTADAAVIVATTSGAGALTLTGTGEATLAVMAGTGGITSADQTVKLNASSNLAAATYNVDALTVTADASAAGRFATMVASGVVDLSAVDVRAGSFTSLSIVAATGSLSLGAHTYAQAITVS